MQVNIKTIIVKKVITAKKAQVTCIYCTVETEIPVFFKGYNAFFRKDVDILSITDIYPGNPVYFKVIAVQVYNRIFKRSIDSRGEIYDIIVYAADVSLQVVIQSLSDADKVTAGIIKNKSFKC